MSWSRQRVGEEKRVGCTSCGKRATARRSRELTPKSGDWVAIRPDGKRQVFRGPDAKRHAQRVALASGGRWEQVPTSSIQ